VELPDVICTSVKKFSECKHQLHNPQIAKWGHSITTKRTCMVRRPLQHFYVVNVYVQIYEFCIQYSCLDVHVCRTHQSHQAATMMVIMMMRIMMMTTRDSPYRNSNDDKLSRLHFIRSLCCFVYFVTYRYRSLQLFRCLLVTLFNSAAALTRGVREAICLSHYQLMSPTPHAAVA